MPDDYQFKKDKRFEDYENSLEANRYIHDTYLKAINHPIRRAILKLFLKNDKPLSKNEIFNQLKQKDLITERETLNYNLDYLVKAFCIKKVSEKEQIHYELTQSGKIIEYLDKI